MSDGDEARPVKASPRDLSAQIRNWAVALTAVAGLIAYVVANPVILRVTFAFAIASYTILPIFMLCLVVMYLALVALSFWMRSPSRMFMARSCATIGTMILALSVAMYELQFTAGLIRLLLFVLYMGFGGAMMIFIEIIAPKWEERGYLRYPKEGPQVLPKPSLISACQTATEEPHSSSATG